MTTVWLSKTSNANRQIARNLLQSANIARSAVTITAKTTRFGSTTSTYLRRTIFTASNDTNMRQTTPTAVTSRSISNPADGSRSSFAPARWGMRNMSTTSAGTVLGLVVLAITWKHRIADGDQGGWFRSFSNLSIGSGSGGNLSQVPLASTSSLILPPTETRPHRLVTLPNKLEVILISDPTADKAAAALDVGVGHLEDPESLPGCAHFCEHLMFLGTKKYPEENAYSTYLSTHNGHSNAYTDLCNTNVSLVVAVGRGTTHSELMRFASACSITSKSPRTLSKAPWIDSQGSSLNPSLLKTVRKGKQTPSTRNTTRTYKPICGGSINSRNICLVPIIRIENLERGI
jgi:hypothetical protein